MGEVLALASALCFGTTHFVAGLVARRTPGTTVAVHTQAGGTVLCVVAALAATDAFPGVRALGWGALSGLGTGVGVAYLYRALSKGAMSVIVPVSDVGAVALPVLVGIAVLGERPSVLALFGMVVAVPAIWLVSGGALRRPRPGRADDGGGPAGAEPAGVSHPGAGDRAATGDPSGTRAERTPPGAPGVPDALVAGVGFAVQYLAIARVPADAGLWPVAASRLVSVAVAVVLLRHAGGPWRLPSRLAAPAVAAGGLGTVALVLYLSAAHQQLVAVATVLSALYPVIPVLLALALLHERVGRGQASGLLASGVAIALIASR
ncbi:EamA family transporter [Streptomyces sp. NPDC051776]|uniref:EamA family transporter n=1 Tax=Streptomyces sp. NPDC051776 TaxID=3155414 RepID=UPI003434A56B